MTINTFNQGIRITRDHSNIALACLVLSIAATFASAQTRINPRSVAAITVAPADAPFEQRLIADYIADGVADEVQVNAALARANLGTGNFDLSRHQGSPQTSAKNSGGHLMLLSGSIYLAQKINAAAIDDLTISGQGPSTVIYNGNATGAHGIEAINATPGDSQQRLNLRDFIIQGNALSGDNIHLSNVEMGLIDNVHSYDAGDDGLEWTSTDGTNGVGNKIITNSQFLWNGDDGIHLEALHETLITSCHVEENTDNGVYLVETTDTTITGCSIEDNLGTYQIEMNGSSALTSFNGVFTFNLANCDVSGGLFVLMNDNGTARISNSNVQTIVGGGNLTNQKTRMYLSNVTCSSLTGTYDRLIVQGAQCNIGAILTTGEVARFGSMRLTTAATSAITFGERFGIVGCDIDSGSTSVTFTASATTEQFILSGCDIGDTGTSGARTIEIDGRPKGGDMEIVVTGNAFALCDLTIRDGIVNFTGNTMRGAGGAGGQTLAITHTERPVAVTGNAMRLMNVDIDNTNTSNCHLVYSGNSHDSNTARTVDLQSAGNGAVVGNVYDANFTVNVAVGLTAANNVGP